MRYAVALDIGGTKIEGILVDEKYNIVRKDRVPALKDSPLEEVVGNMFSLIDRLKEGYDISGIGVSIPDHVASDGTVGEMIKIQSLKGYNLKKGLKERYDTKIAILNDADCFALAEHSAGNGKGYSNMVGVIIGTGVGAGIVIDDKLYFGEHNYVGEFGHNVIDPSGPLCRCGLHGCSEAWFSGPKIVERYKAKGGSLEDSDVRAIWKSDDPVAVLIREETVDKIGLALAQLVNILDPGIIVIGGGVSNLDFYDEVNEATRRYSLGEKKQYVKVVKNKLGDSAGVIGAAALILEDKPTV